MGALRCVDGSELSVEAVTCRDRVGQPYEITLKLARNSVPFAAVGQRCGHQLSDLAARVSAARQDPEQAAAWPDPDDRFPHGAGVLPGDHEYFALRSHERFDLPESGELRCVLRSTAVWVGECVGVGAHSRAGHGHELGRRAVPGQRAVPGPATESMTGEPMTAEPMTAESMTAESMTAVTAEPAVPLQAADQDEQPAQQDQHGHRAWRHRPGGQGRWQLSRRAVIEAWGAGGVGVRAVLTSAELVAFLDTVLNGPESAAATGEIPIEGPQTGGHPGGHGLGGVNPQFGRQRGRVPDGIARSRLPAV